jgi:septal ring factor EnvC (AmiA/AmiB activator)
MSEPEKTKLELSKARLALAFNNLESIIEDKMNLTKSQKLELAAISNKVERLTQENSKLSSDLANLELDYHSIKNYGFEIIEEIDSSIASIEEILGTDHGNSKRID